ncbi:response regulator [Acetobacterium fimetarium]|uniref:Stage 0 sporulation protein A homolog n=1 Tax=Acetobacterium fimetarium TaxID=52691 RepID=A0ABR6WUB6_9FIRM|nr:response regulator transcription factor [Acetobacterium fimetarium]MBC3804219.1 response regulator [Acetobacterium fimetarium]
MFKILVIEDEAKIAGIMVENLSKAGYDAAAVTEFCDILPEFIAFKPDLVLLDIILPFYDGYYWCGKIRLLSKVPIIFVSSKSTDMDIIIATNMGGDDFIVKPFSIDILLAKVAGLLRRTYSYDNSEMDIIAHEGLIFNRSSGVVSVNENTMKLTKNEAQILALLLKNRGRAVSRERIMRSLWKDASFIDDNTLTVNITRLRKKLRDLGLENVIETKKNQGYMI